MRMAQAAESRRATPSRLPRNTFQCKLQDAARAGKSRTTHPLNGFSPYATPHMPHPICRTPYVAPHMGICHTPYVTHPFAHVTFFLWIFVCSSFRANSFSNRSVSMGQISTGEMQRRRRHQWPLFHSPRRNSTGYSPLTRGGYRTAPLMAGTLRSHSSPALALGRRRWCSWVRSSSVGGTVAADWRVESSRAPESAWGVALGCVCAHGEDRLCDASSDNESFRTNARGTTRQLRVPADMRAHFETNTSTHEFIIRVY